MRPRLLVGPLMAAVLAGCANHPIDCAVGFYHADCLPGTAGYSDPNKFADVDDKQCRSYGLSPGTSEYADCRIKLSSRHQSPEPTIGGAVIVPVR